MSVQNASKDMPTRASAYPSDVENLGLCVCRDTRQSSFDRCVFKFHNRQAPKARGHVARKGYALDDEVPEPCEETPLATVVFNRPGERQVV
jgi:hypothetical protein